ncbi:hypothetical protein [Aquibacillus saliphilus]|uniref:hypothetical protein n=1 Tax=Aquibacillus saliphilus TaxID=1909422 RepID=UPI001CF022F8|nr:hypothetical protein [Aquibacillus saliphilus]
MTLRYSLLTLKDKREKLRGKLNDIDESVYENRHPKENIERLRTKIKNDISDIDYSIEILEEHHMNYE